MGFMVPTRVATIYDAGTEPVSVTLIAKVGQAVASILLHPSKTANRFLKIQSLLITQRDLLAAFEEIIGQAWEVKCVETKDLLAQAKEKLAKGDFIEAFLRVLTVQLFEGGVGRTVVMRVESDNELLGVTKDDLGEVLRGALSTVGAKAWGEWVGAVFQELYVWSCTWYSENTGNFVHINQIILLRSKVQIKPLEWSNSFTQVRRAYEDAPDDILLLMNGDVVL